MRKALDKISTQILRTVPFVVSLLVPLFFLPITADIFAFNKYFLIAFIGSVSLLAWCVRNITRGELHFTTSPALIPIGLLILANIISSVWLSPIKHVSLFGQTSLFFFLGIIYLTVTSSQKNRFVIVSSIYGLISSAVILSIFSLLHYFGLIAHFFPSDLASSKLFNPAGSVLPALSFTIPVLIGTVIYSISTKNWIIKSSLFASILLMIIGSIINISLILPQNSVPVIALLPISAGWSIAIDTMKTWQTALFGTGPETFFSAFTRLRPSYLNLNNNIWNIRFSESSNFLFTLITTTGLLGALSFLVTYLRSIFVFQKSKHLFEEKSSVGFIFAALIATVISFLVIPTGIVSLTMSIILLICLTLELKLINSKSVKDIDIKLSADSSNSSSYNELSGSTKTTVSSTVLPWLKLFASVALLSAFWFFAVRMYAASVSFKQAVSLSSSDPYASFLKYQKSAQLDIYNPYYQQKLSSIYLAVADAYLTKEDATAEEKTAGTDFAQRALDAGKISTTLDPLNVTNWENLFNIYRSLIPYAQGSADMAISHGLQAASIDPTNPAIYLQIGTLFYNLGDTDQAVKFIDRALELKQNWDLPYFNLSSIYKVKKDYNKALQYAQAGLQYTDPKSADLPTIQEEISSLQKLVPAPAATQSGTIQQ